MAFCSGCGVDIQDNNFCPSCGKQANSTADLKQTSNVNTLAMWTHLGALIVGLSGLFLIITAFLAWLPAFLIKQSNPDSPFVIRHANESMNFQLQWLIISIPFFLISFIFTLVSLGFGAILVLPIAIALSIFMVVVEIIATIAASKGEEYSYPLMFFRLIKS
ncbi:DUF4870 domain-containing protein [Arenimonas sp.]|jgi:uncharacterized Tic20 family protein|uniref:DUF4870 domain-containing protein n=1 Tax=Arenimonas sp. TaxID=1872635 RepID=UPI0037BEFD19